jgi:Domain of unknown function (DUF4189)
MKTRLFLLLCLLVPSYTAVAEGGCPPGMYPPNPANTSVCYPFPESQQPAPVQQPQAPRGHWETRWGAIAVDNVKGRLGGVTNHSSKNSATKAAMTECYRQGGGKDCKVKLTYYNQCAAVAWGEESYVAAGRDELEEANRYATESCSKATPNCKVVYNACSNAKWISY